MSRKMLKKVNTQKGSATVEALIAFTGFLFVIFTILGTVNLCRAQMLVSAAVDAAAKELSQYAYFYQMSGLQKLDQEITGQADVGKENINEIIGTVDNLYSTLGGAVDKTVEEATNLAEVTQKGELELQDFETAIMNVDTQGNNIVNSISSMTSAFEKVGDDPLLYMRSLVAIAGGEASEYVKKAIAVPLAKLFVQKHFGSNRVEANETLEGLGIEGGLDSMNFNMSTVFSDDDKEDIQIVVYYKIKLLSVLDWEALEVNLCKQAVCRAWLGGDDVQVYVKASIEEPAGTSESTEENETTEVTTEVTEESTEETEESTTEEVVDVEGSYWYKGIDGHGYDEKAAAFDELLVNSKNIDREETVVNGLIYGRDQNNVAYGMTYCATAEEAEGISLWAYSISMESLKAMEDAYSESDGTRGYEPGSTTSYKYVVYVPENIPDDEVAAIEAASREDAQTYHDYAIKEYGIDIPIGIEIIRAGGNYDYGKEE